MERKELSFEELEKVTGGLDIEDQRRTDPSSGENGTLVVGSGSKVKNVERYYSIDFPEGCHPDGGAQ